MQFINPLADGLFSERGFQVMKAATALEQQGRDVINLGIGQPDFSTPPAIAEAAVQAIRDGQHGYTAAEGILAIREAVVADYHRRYPNLPDARLPEEQRLHPDRVLLVPGGKVTMFLAITLLGAPGADILYPDPGFPMYRSLAQYSGARALPYRLRFAQGFALDLDEIAAQVSERTRLIIINTPNNPTGAVIPPQQLQELAKILAPYPDCFVLSDEIYAECVFQGHRHHTLLMESDIRDRLILLDGFSKRYAMTGWRLGYAIWPERLIAYAKTLAVNVHSCVNTPVQYAGVAALSREHPEEAIMRTSFEQRAAAACAALNELDGVDCLPAGGAFYLFPKVRSTAEQVEHDWLAEHAVAVIAGEGFGQSDESFVRLSVANDRIGEAISRLRHG